jgi:hypothetical protein
MLLELYSLLRVISWVILSSMANTSFVEVDWDAALLEIGRLYDTDTSVSVTATSIRRLTDLDSTSYTDTSVFAKAFPPRKTGFFSLLH